MSIYISIDPLFTVLYSLSGPKMVTHQMNGIFNSRNRELPGQQSNLQVGGAHRLPQGTAGRWGMDLHHSSKYPAQNSGAAGTKDRVCELAVSSRVEPVCTDELCGSPVRAAPARPSASGGATSPAHKAPCIPARALLPLLPAHLQPSIRAGGAPPLGRG